MSRPAKWVPLKCSGRLLIEELSWLLSRKLTIPLPNPVSNREAMSWPRLKDEHCIAAPTIIIQLPVNIVFFRPSMLPSQMVAIAPKKQPKVYPPTVIPKPVSQCCYCRRCVTNRMTRNFERRTVRGIEWTLHALYIGSLSSRPSIWRMPGVDLRKLFQEGRQCKESA